MDNNCLCMYYCNIEIDIAPAPSTYDRAVGRSETRLDEAVRTLTPDKINPVVAHANYFESTPGARWGPRTIPDIELILMIEGESRFECLGADPLTLAAGEVLAIFPGEEHVFRVSDRPGHPTFSCIHSELLPDKRYLNGDYRLDPAIRRRTDVRGDGLLRDFFHRLAQTMSGYGAYREAMLSTLAKAVWLRLAEHWSGAGEIALSPRLRELTSYVRANLPRQFARAELAERFSLSPEYLSSLFRKELGLPLTEFINRERVLYAYRLMREEGLRVKEAAARSGFRDQFYFSRVFKKVLGLPPTRIG